MSDSKKKPKMPPPDDFSKTVPNVNIPDEIDAADWDKTHYGVSSEPPVDDWGKTVINYDVNAEPKHSETHYENNSPKEPDWGMTQANVNIDHDFGPNDRVSTGDDSERNATVPYFQLPEDEREKYQNIPPTPTEKVRRQEEEKRKKGGIPVWFWITAGLMSMFFFAVLLLLGVWYFVINDRSYDVTVTGAPIGSRFFVDGSEYGVPSTQNEHRLVNLDPDGIKRIEIRHSKFECEPREVRRDDGSNQRFSAVCRPMAEEPKIDCQNTRNIDEREKCAEIALDNLGDPPDLDALLKALNLLIINFESGKFDIPPARMAILRKAAAKIQKLPDSVEIEIGGHTDNVGSDANNQKLSENRANAVKKFLVDAGVKDSILSTKGYGELNPKASNETAQGRFDNRRIEYKAVKR